MKKKSARKTKTTAKATTRRAVKKSKPVKKSKSAKKVVKKKTSKVAKGTLNGISDIRRFFYRNETPIYFISATNFNLLGADEWIKGFKFI